MCKKRAVHCFIVGHCKHVLLQRGAEKQRLPLRHKHAYVHVCAVVVPSQLFDVGSEQARHTRTRQSAKERRRGERETQRRAHHRCHVLSVSLSLSAQLSSLSLLFCNSRCGHSKIKRGEAANERCVLRWLTASLPFGCSSVSLSMIFQASRFSASGRRVPLEPRRSEACRSCQPMHVLSFGEGRSLFFCVPVRVRQPAFGKCELASWWSLI